MNKAQSELCRRLNYTFAEPALLERALTHRSRSGDNYERLEFLGDSVLNFVVSGDLYKRFPELSEGELTRLRASLVKKETLAAVARDLVLGDSLVLGSGELKSGGFDRDSILADSLEAVFGAVYIDRGIDSARELILQLLAPHFGRLDPRAIPKDPKTRLQEYLQKQSVPLPIYNVLQIAGDPHNQLFIVECQVPELSLTTRGEGSTRRAAEQQAAQTAYERISKQ
ncbi:MAG: ribonuclease III [Gammaproteobacteria bacterium]|nr:ribonuclease III [Gammaproteobacteria bacterium]